ncbi:MAG: A/G-specific adenine glycosylase [Bacteroidetes bacterium]|nr:A/G-specific adenine glycosylase [Bacteroidota bacterium]
MRHADKSRRPDAGQSGDVHAALTAQASILHRLLLGWYRRNGRPLPWRQDNDPYTILVSEIMLQQTQVARVTEHLPHWLQRFPSIDTLAAASKREVLLAWSGMGYNRRALHLHAAASLICSRHNGIIPNDTDALLALPGIGRYTAHAVVCFAYGKRLPMVEVNIRRVLSRLASGMQRENAVLPETVTWKLAASLLPPRAYFAWNQALMDLGAMICTATRPACSACPFSRLCPSAHRLLPTPDRNTQTVRETPRRLYRGRLIEFLRKQPGHCATAAELHRLLFPDSGQEQRMRLFDILDSLRKDGMIDIHERSPGISASGTALNELRVCLAE